MKTPLILIFATIGCSTIVAETPVLQTPFSPHPGFLGTCEYSPLPAEKPFYEKVPEENRSTVSGFSPSEEAFFRSGMLQSDSPVKSTTEVDTSKPVFSLSDEIGEYVGWYGIVTKIEKHESKTLLTIQNKYSNGTTDCHLQTVSIYGAGDFSASIDLESLEIPALSLIKVYGVVSQDEDGIPLVEVELLRYWRWLSFNFSDYGLDSGLAESYRNMDTSDLRVYSSRPDGQYYIDRIDAPREHFVKAVTWWNANQEQLWQEKEKANKE